jgi:hypothetical protein
LEGECKMSQVVVVIGDRLGKGHHVAKGVEAAGGKAIVISGVGATCVLVMLWILSMLISVFHSVEAVEQVPSLHKQNTATQHIMACVLLMKASQPLMKEKKYSVLVLWIQKSLARELRKPI